MIERVGERGRKILKERRDKVGKIASCPKRIIVPVGFCCTVEISEAVAILQLGFNISAAPFFFSFSTK